MRTAWSMYSFEMYGTTTQHDRHHRRDHPAVLRDRQHRLVGAVRRLELPRFAINHLCVIPVRRSPSHSFDDPFAEEPLRPEEQEHHGEDVGEPVLDCAPD